MLDTLFVETDDDMDVVASLIEGSERLKGTHIVVDKSLDTTTFQVYSTQGRSL